MCSPATLGAEPAEAMAATAQRTGGPGLHLCFLQTCQPSAGHEGLALLDILRGHNAVLASSGLNRGSIAAGGSHAWHL